MFKFEWLPDLPVLTWCYGVLCHPANTVYTEAKEKATRLLKISKQMLLTIDPEIQSTFRERVNVSGRKVKQNFGMLHSLSCYFLGNQRRHAVSG